MAAIKPIRTGEDLERAFARIDEIFDAGKGTPESDELDVLLDLVELYESRQEPMGYPDPVAAIEFRMDQAGLKQRDLIPFIGSRAKVSEVLSGKRAITMPMARALHQHLGISAEVLLQKPGAAVDRPGAGLEWNRFPLKEMAKRGWIPDLSDLSGRAEQLIRGLIDRAGGPDAAAAVLYRRNDHRRVNASTDRYALRGWGLQVLAEANAAPPRSEYRPGVATPDFLRQVARLSHRDNGVRQARDFLARHGIALQILPHLPRTHLDGAALWSGDGRPVIGLTLRYDRIDNFWFTLLHELAHVGLHLDNDRGDWFVDDLTLPTPEGGEDPAETEADERARDALIPPEAWEASPVRVKPSAVSVINLALTLGIHPAIVAGRVRHERGNYRLLSQFVGTGEVRRQFEGDHPPPG